MRITLIISSLSAGGAERVLSTLANEWIGRGHAVTLITLGPVLTDWFPLDPSVRRIGLDLLVQSMHVAEALRNNLRRLSRLRQAVRDSGPDIVIAFGDTTNVLTLLACTGMGIRTIVSERVDPRQHPLGSGWNRLRSLSYRRAEALVVQTEALRGWAEGIVPKEAVHVIPNPVRSTAAGRTQKGPASDRSGPRVIAMGRLTKQKGFDLLLEAFARCRPHHANWRLCILGEGEERRSLETQASGLHIRDSVEMPGVVKDQDAQLACSDLFVLSSRYEGFPNALLEAMACGLPVIATDCPTGPAEIITHDENGLLVPAGDSTALAEAMQRLMSDADERRRLAARAPEVRQRFSPEVILDRWDRLLLAPCTNELSN